MNKSQLEKNAPGELSELEKMFFENFTKKQESGNDFLLRLLLLIGSVITAYGYLLLKIDIEKYDVRVILFMLIFTEILLMIYYKIIMDEGFAFRRDQIVVYRILKKYGLIAENESESGDIHKVFPYYFHPLKKFEYIDGQLKSKNKQVIFLMPAFYNTLASAIFLIHLLIYGSFLVKIDDTSFGWYLLALSLLTTTISVMIVRRKYLWLKKLYLMEIKAQYAAVKDMN